MKSDAELFEKIVEVVSSMASDPLQLPARDYFADDESLSNDEFARLADMKEDTKLTLHRVSDRVAFIVIRSDFNA